MKAKSQDRSTKMDSKESDPQGKKEINTLVVYIETL